jgi:hypothetical protein
MARGQDNVSYWSDMHMTVGCFGVLTLKCNDPTSVCLMQIRHRVLSFQTNKVPWKHMATSLPLWSIFICHMCGTWAEYTLITSLPAFMKGVLKFDIKSVRN